MRGEYCSSMVELAARAPYFFLTGDLGFMALEPLAEALGGHFINAGVSEQNMVSVAAGIAREGYPAWVYSIAPFCYARPFEQIRNDVCFNKMPVKLVGNGGGYAYGPMGATHHALEDYGVLLALPGMRCYVPAFSKDVGRIVAKMGTSSEPSYLRLGRSEIADESSIPEYQPWRKLLEGGSGLIVAVGPMAGGLLLASRDKPYECRPALWVVAELCAAEANEIPAEFAADLAAAAALAIAEEHVATGSFAQHLTLALAHTGRIIPPLLHAHAVGYPSGRYGSQAWHRKESGLDATEILRRLAELSAQRPSA